MPVVQQAQAFDNLNDLARIEVLKGPQGTLFGKNASAGVINIVTQDPASDFSERVTMTSATDGDRRADAVVSVPIAEDVGLRVTGFYHDFDGTVQNLTLGGKLNDLENYGVRAKLKAALTPDVTFTLTGAYSKAVQDGTGTTIRSISGTGTPNLYGIAAFPLLRNLAGVTPGANNRRTRVDLPGATDNRTTSVSGRINVDAGFADILSITSYQHWKYQVDTDVEGTDINVLGLLTGGLVNGGIAQSSPSETKNFTQELRLVSKGGGPLNYVIGAFYSNARSTRGLDRGPIISVARWEGRNKNESIGLFAQADYTLPTDTTITGGLRYNHEKIDVAFDNLVPGASANTCGFNNPLCRGSNSDGVVTWRGTVSQQLARQIMLYGSVARGYKGFAYDIVTGFNPASIDGSLSGTGPGLTGVGPVRPETSTAYEIGVKSRFLDNRVQLNVTGFYTDYNDFQAQAFIPVGSPPTFQFILNNVGKLRTKGIEAELSVKATDWLRFDGGATYTDAVMREFRGASAYSGQPGQVYNSATDTSTLIGNCIAAPVATAAAPRTNCVLQDRSGGRLPNAPKFKWNLSSTAEFPLADDATGTFVLSYQHQSAVNFDLFGNPLTTQRGYGLFNASLGAQIGQFGVTAFVNNLFNTHFAASLADLYGSYGGSATNDAHVITQFLTRDSQRYFGLRASVSF